MQSVWNKSLKKKSMNSTRKPDLIVSPGSAFALQPLLLLRGLFWRQWVSYKMPVKQHMAFLLWAHLFASLLVDIWRWLWLHECHVPWLKWKSPCGRCVRTNSERTPPRSHLRKDPCLLIPPLEVLGVCPNFLCRNFCTANRRQNCVTVLIAYTCWTPSHIQSLFWASCREMWEAERWQKPQIHKAQTTCIRTSFETVS